MIAELLGDVAVSRFIMRKHWTVGKLSVWIYIHIYILLMLFYSFYSFYIHVRDMNREGKEKKKKSWLFGIGADVIL